ncbi:Hypothetical predicted protein [Podarcis lilfordi]|uniref:Uncharacterized protein n=1 Tax=Podarcis lilfordi TaxID=74358 RepID=A0AA35KNH0_9SAUR|nr:Hypothetical predicted protein [Podarcis lilfordi]
MTTHTHTPMLLPVREAVARFACFRGLALGLRLAEAQEKQALSGRTGHTGQPFLQPALKRKVESRWRIQGE